MTREVFKEFKKAYNKAVGAGELSFIFQGEGVLVDYAKDMIEYHEGVRK